MALKHLVRRYPNPKLDDFVLVESGLYQPVKGSRVRAARKKYLKLQKDELFTKNEEQIQFVEPGVFGLVGVGLGMWATGLLGNLVNAPASSGLWAWSSKAYPQVVAAHPELFMGLSLEMGAAIGIDRFIRIRKRAVAADKSKADWEHANFKNDELIHVFRANTDLDTRYAGEQLYYFTGKDYLPKTAFQMVKDPKAKGGERRLEWSRFHRDGPFKLCIGEVYEQKGRFNSHPRLKYIPYSGLVTGVAVFGPTGSGKSATIALPFLDQGMGYYHWIDSERDAWMFKASTAITNLKTRLLKAGSSEEKAEIKKQISLIERESTEILEKMAQGEDAGFGFSKMTVICIEPKDEIWATQLNLCKRFKRVNDYIELGVVRERYKRFQDWSTKLGDTIRCLWSYAPNAKINGRMAQWLFNFGEENGIISSEREGTTLWYKDLSKADKFKQIPQRLGPDKKESAIFRDLNGVYGVPKGKVPEDSKRWIGRSFERANPLRVKAAIAEHADGVSDRNADEEVPSLQTLVNKTVAAVPLPWGTIARADDIPEDMSVLGFGFGLARDPWVRNADAKRVRNTMLGKPGQRVVIGTVQRLGMLYALIGDRPKIRVEGTGAITKLSPKRTSGSVLDWSSWELDLRESIKEQGSEQVEAMARFLQRQGDIDDLAEGYLPIPNYEPNGVMQPTQAGKRDGDEPSEDDLVVRQFKEALNLMPGERKEAVRLRKKIRAAAPPARKPMERRYSFRLKYAFWRADRKRVQYNFIEGVLRVLFLLGNDGFEATSKALAFSGAPFGEAVLNEMVKACPSGMLEATARYALNAPETMVGIVRYLEKNGYEYFGDVVADAKAAQNEGLPYDAFTFFSLRPTWSLLKRLCERDSIPLHEDGDRYADIQSHLRLRRVETAHRDALVLCALFSGVGSTEELRPLAKRLQEVFTGVGATEEHLSDPEWLSNAIESVRKHDLKRNMAYAYDPRVPTIDPITEDPEDYEASIDCEPIVFSLGPWDALWCEGVGAAIWEPMRSLGRDAMVKAFGIYAEEEANLTKIALVNNEGGSLRARDAVERALTRRRDEAFEGTMTFLRAIEDYLRTLSPYYKANTPLPYGFKDFGGIGDCCGSTKFNPLHHPDMTPSQTASLLLGILSRNAGSGDTSFWNDSGILISEAMISLTRAARGYITVSDLNQMIVSDNFVDLTISQAEARLTQMRATAGGTMGEKELKETMFRDQWAAQFGLCKAEVMEAAGEQPAEVWTLLPRAASGSEIKEMEGYLNAGRSFITTEWRSDGGSFADKEIRGTCKLNLINQLTPVTQGIGAYSFSPEDADELSFPSPTEMRNLGMIVATRFNYAVDKKLGSIVIGMFIAAYQMMVLSAKQRQTEAKDTFVRINQMKERQQAALIAMREKVRSLRKQVQRKVAPVDRVRAFLGQVFRQLKPEQDRKTMMLNALLKAEKEGVLDGELGSASLAGLRFIGVQENSQMLLMNVASDARFIEEYLSAEVNKLVAQREEDLYGKRDLIRELEGRIWAARQDILNGLSELEEFPDWSRLAMFLVDEAHFFLNANAKGSVLTDTDFLSTARAGKSVNVYITQTPSSIRGSGMSMDTWEQWISNTLLRVCLGAPNKQDQEYISDLFRGEKVKKEKESGFSLSFEGADVDEMSGNLRASKVESGSRTYQTTEEHEKFVSPDDLARMPVMSSWVESTDGQTRSKPELVYHPPYFLMTSPLISKVTGEPIANKSWLALVRDGELNLVPPENERMREIFGLLAQSGHDVSSQVAELDAMNAMLQGGNSAVVVGEA